MVDCPICGSKGFLTMEVEFRFFRCSICKGEGQITNEYLEKLKVWFPDKKDEPKTATLPVKCQLELFLRAFPRQY